MGKEFNNVNVDEATVGTEVTFHSGSGTNNATNKYLNIAEGMARKVNILADKASSLIKINNVDLDDAKSLGAALAATIDTDGVGGKVITSVTIRIDTVTTHVEVMMF